MPRNIHCTPEETDRRIAHIANLMVTMQWQGGISVNALAQEWGISPSRVSNLSGDASRLIRVDPIYRERLRATLAHQMSDIVRDASARKSTVTGMPDYRARIEATEKMGKYLGCDVNEPAPGVAVAEPQKITISFDGVQVGVDHSSKGEGESK